VEAGRVDRLRSILAAFLLVLGAASLGLPASATAQPAVNGRSTLATTVTDGSGGTPEQRASDYMESVRENPLLLRAFLWEMPKGGDIHNHLAGAVYAEDLIAIAARHGLCGDISSFVLSNPPCNAAAGRPNVADNLTNGAVYNGTINAWSMREFLPGAESGHDHFFSTFGKFGLAASLDIGDQLAAVASHAASQNELYLELMHTVDGSAAADLGSKIGWDSDLVGLRSRLMASGMDQIAAAAVESWVWRGSATRSRFMSIPACPRRWPPTTRVSREAT
jgi:adenosine deaminase